MTNLVVFILSVTFFAGMITCPSSNDEEKIRILARLSKVVVKNYESKVVHEYKNAGLYSIKRPSWVVERMPYLSWYTIRVRKSSHETFRTLADMCGLEIELLLLTEKIVKMVLKEKYEYTLYFESSFHAESFANVLYHTAIKDGEREQNYKLEKVFMARNGDDHRLVESSAWISQKKISNQLVIYYVKTELQMMKMIFSSRHYSIDLGERPFQLSLTPMVVKGRPLDYRYTLSFYKKLDMGKFLRIATDHEFNAEAIYEEAQYRSELDDSLSDYLDFYDEDELQYFHQAETQLNWNVEY